MTVQAPLYMQDKVNTGFLAGFLNGCSYMGNAMSTYGLGLMVDGSGWMGVFVLLTGISAFSAVIAAIYYVNWKRKAKEENSA